jgi:hypothetical protein
MLKNVLQLTENYMVISWSPAWDDFKGTVKQEHFNPRPKAYVKRRLTALGLKFRPRLTNQLHLRLNQSAAFPHWSKNLLIFTK